MLRKKLSKPGTLFASYLANMNMSDTSVFSSGVELTKPTRSYILTEGALPDNLKVDILLRKIGTEYSWQNRQMKSDMIVLFENRIYTVKDLRTLSKESWKKIELLPLVKDLLRDSVNRGRVNLDDDLVKNKREKREILGSNEIKRDMDNANNIIKEVRPVVSEKKRIDEVAAKPAYNEKKMQMRPIDSSIEQPKLYLPPPNKMVIGNDRMKVKTSNGKIYEVDRLCPHAKSDLSTRGVVIGSKLFCTKHCLAYDLENGGMCTSKHENITINACPVDDW